MKKFIYAIAFSTLLATLTSCTADEIEPIKKIEPATSIAKDVTYIPPTTTPTPTKP
jgi:hypothetical protein